MAIIIKIIVTMISEASFYSHIILYYITTNFFDCLLNAANRNYS